MTCSSDVNYTIGGCNHEDAWYIQAQYIWSESVGPSTAQSVVKGWVGEMIKVAPGQTISTNISYAPCNGSMGWSLEISADGGKPSSLCVTTPFMGRVANYSAPYSSGGTADYWGFILGDLHEAWYMNDPGYYPESETFEVAYYGKSGGSVNADQVKQDACDNHATEGSCADRLSMPTLSRSTTDRCVFTNHRNTTSVVTV